MVGLGDIGVEIARTAERHPGLDVVGAVDIDPTKAGRPLGAFTGLNGQKPVPVLADLDSLVTSTVPEVVLLSTSSRFDVVARDAVTCFEGGVSVITTCEEMTYPWDRPGVDELAEAAEAAGRAILGVGVNPGFVMDLLPALLTVAAVRVDRIRVERRVDLNRRRPALRKKAGVGLARPEFERLAQLGQIGHVGLDSSARLLAAALGLDLGWPVVEIEPITMNGDDVVGFRQRTGWPSISPEVELDLEMSVALDEEFDRISIQGEPSFVATIDGGISGDVATAAIVVNAVPLVLHATPGVKTVLDVPPLRAWCLPT